jgi:hypothetical protein
MFLLIGTDDGKGQCVTKSSPFVGSKSTQPKKTVPSSRSPPSTISVLSSGKKGSLLKSNDKDSRMGTLYQRDHDKSSDNKLETPVSKTSLSNTSTTKEDDIKRCDFEASKSASYQNATNSKADVKQVFYSKISDEKLRKFGGSKARVVPCSDEDQLDTDVTINNVNDVCESPQDVEDLSLIREQLLQIENQQSNLLDLLQVYCVACTLTFYSVEYNLFRLVLFLSNLTYIVL